VANFGVANNPRNFDRTSGEWKDGEALFMRCNIWRQDLFDKGNDLESNEYDEYPGYDSAGRSHQCRFAPRNL